MSDPETLVRKFQKELNAGTVALVLLGILERADSPMYGYQIVKGVERDGEDDPPMMKQGALYPVLRSLEKNGLLASRVEPSVTGPPRRYYEITGSGRETLKQWKETWRRTRDFVDGVVEGTSHE
ncbi:MAG: PadR family transcriptional regulator [Candidatus Eisenbacteria bacterium]